VLGGDSIRPSDSSATNTMMCAEHPTLNPKGASSGQNPLSYM
jgi:hypothetical protein